MGFITVYYFNIMWLDVIFMAPLVILGIDRLFEGKKLLLPVAWFIRGITGINSKDARNRLSMIHTSEDSKKCELLYRQLKMNFVK